jgi:hypothetical protein
MVFFRFVHFPVLFIEKYRYGENRGGQPKIITLTLSKSLYWSKNAQNILKKNP